MTIEQKIELKNEIINFMKQDGYKPLFLDELAEKINISQDNMEEFTKLVQEIEEDGTIIRTKKKKYELSERMGYIVGRIQGNERGYGFLIPDDENTGDVFIPLNALKGAINGDRVLGRIIITKEEGKRAEGEVERIIKRVNKTMIGTFEENNYFGFVIPDNKKISTDIFIPKNGINKAKTGQKVVVEITKWPELRKSAEGRIIEIIGNKDDKGVDIISIIKGYDLKEEFPESVLDEANRIKEEIDPNIIKSRRDLRDLKMVTIDGEDAKDLDDAVSIEILENGNYRLGVHIADVSEYVTEGSELDKEAFERGTSVYLVDRVIPMLPRKLSNGICSLNPKVDRLSFSVLMEIDKYGEVKNHDIFESVIKINERMTYTDVYKILEENDKELKKKYSDLVDDFEKMKELSLILRQKRVKRGAIDFDFEEAKIVLNEEGKPVDIKAYEITIANKLIEEFMLVCNETVAEHFYWSNTPFIYRIHEEPESDKMTALNEFIYNFGYSIKGINNKVHPSALQEVLNKVKGNKEERIISTVMLRSLQKAKYSPVNQGHFGLAAQYYSHFTSPIRRYPDLMIHRIMKECLRNGLSKKKEEYLNENLPNITKQCSEREKRAEGAERDTEDLKKAEYMRAHVGEEFKGIVSNVTSFGMFVELENTIEGLVRVSSMEDDFYQFDEKNYALIGERTCKSYHIGDELEVILARADTFTRQIDFVLKGTNIERYKKPRAVNTRVKEKTKEKVNDGTAKKSNRKTKAFVKNKKNGVRKNIRKNKKH